MHVSLFRLTSFLIIGAALAMVPGAAALRGGGRDRDRGRRSTTRAGYQRLDGAESTYRSQADPAFGGAASGQDAPNRAEQRQAGSAPVVLSQAGGLPPGSGSVLLPPPSSLLLHSSGRFLHVLGRAPPNV